MNIKKLFAENEQRAVSPVIGVILMVAITVILAAVIGAFVIGIGDDQAATPTASLSFDQSSDTLDISHSSGDQLEELEISFSGDVTADVIDSDAAYDDLDDLIREEWAGGDEITAGDSIELSLDEDAESGTDDWGGEGEEPYPVLDQDTNVEGSINIVWSSSDTDQSSVLTSYDYELDAYYTDS